MKKTILILFLLILVFINNLNAQSNLVPNGDFETYTLLPITTGQSNRATGWNNVNGIYNFLTGSPDYFNQISFTVQGLILPYSGNGQMGLIIFYVHQIWREYISTQFYEPMKKGIQYKISFYLTNGTCIEDAYKSGTNNFGLHFSNNILYQASYEPINVNPQINIDTVTFIYNYWKHYTYTYIATDTFKYLTIGNFKDDTHTLVQNFGQTEGAYYFIDKIEIIPLLTIKGDSVICVGNPVTLLTYGDSIVNWKSTLNPNILIATDSFITVSPTVTTTYYAYTNYDTAYFTVNVVSLPIINLGNDTILCQGQSIQLNATTSFATYLWQDGTNNSKYIVNQQGTYSVKVTIDSNCYAKDSIHVIYKPIPIVNLGKDTTICSGQSLILNATYPNATYKWQDNTTSPKYNVISTGVYSVIVTLDNYCYAGDTINITVLPKPTVFIGNDTTLCNGQTLLLNAQYPNAIYQWQDGSTSSIFNVTQVGTFWVKVTDTSTKCSSIATIKLTCDLEPIIPNIITPNGDGYNDYFVITNTEGWKIDLQVYSRWGNIVFQDSDYKNNWDGKSKGNPLADGTYFYIIKATNQNGGIVKDYHGSVMILR